MSYVPSSYYLELLRYLQRLLLLQTHLSRRSNDDAGEQSQLPIFYRARLEGEYLHVYGFVEGVGPSATHVMPGTGLADTVEDLPQSAATGSTYLVGTDPDDKKLYMFTGRTDSEHSGRKQWVEVAPSATVSDHVDPEQDFVENNAFWFAATEEIFEDYDTRPTLMPHPRFSWMVNGERKKRYPSLKVDLQSPVIQMKFCPAQLQNLVGAVPENDPLMLYSVSKPPSNRWVASGIGVGQILGQGGGGGGSNLVGAAYTAHGNKSIEPVDGMFLGAGGAGQPLSMTMTDAERQDTPPSNTTPTGS